MKKVLLAIVVVGSLLALAGCGGGDSGTATTGTEGAGGAAPQGTGAPPAPAATSSAQSAEEMTKPVAFTPTAETPASVRKHFKKKVMCIEFYIPGDPVTADVAQQVAPLKKDFAKQVAFLTFDANNAATSAVLSEQLEAGYCPYFVIIDKRGFIVYRHSGYIDTLTLEQGLFSTLRR